MILKGQVRQHLLQLLVALFFLALAAPSWASFPASGQAYPNGAEDFVSGALPPPGVYLKNYFALIQKNRLADDDGSKVPANFSADVTVVVPRFIWVTPVELLGASWATQIFLPMYWADVQSDDLAPPGERLDNRAAGMGDIIFTPMALGWHFSPNFHMIGALDFFLPTGNYEADNLASQIVAKNHWTIQPVIALTYLRGGMDVSVKFMYDFTTKNDDYILGGVGPGELDSGQAFHFDWGVGYAPKEGLRVGLAGYSYWQTTKDEFSPDGGGDTIDSDKGVVHAIGPAVKYWPNKGRFSATLKYNWEFGAKNLPEGQATWLNLVWVF